MSIKLPSYILLSFLSFARHFWGTIFSPYQTYRELIKFKYPLESFFIALLILGYIGLSSLLRKGLDSGPLLLTLHSGKIFWGIFFTFVISWGLIYFIGKFFGGSGNPQALFLPWVYSLLPTIIWFQITSLLYFLLPPPRTTAFKGQLFSVFFITISLTLFYWKGVLYYLTLRFGHKLDLIKILLVSLMLFPIGVVYSLFTYKLGLFRIPFL